MERLTRLFRILLVAFMLPALGVNFQSGAAQATDRTAALPPGGDAFWNPNFALGADDWIYAEAVAPNGDIYVGGDLNSIGGVQTGRVARWGAADHQWHNLGKSITWGRVYSLAISGSYLYVGGYFDAINGQAIAVNGIARWNMTSNTWETVGGVGFARTSGSPDVYALTVDGSGNVYAGGDFTSVNGVTVQNVAKWNGSAWSAVGSLGTTSEKVEVLVWHGSTLIAGGNFAALHYIAAWSGAAWSSLGGGADKEVLTLASDSGNLYVGGSLTKVTNPNASTVTVHYIAMWNWSGNYWQDMGGGFDGPDVDALAVGPDGKLYAGGRFHSSGSTTTSNLARWNGSWEAVHASTSLAEGVDGNVYALAFSGQDLWVGGGFQSSGELSAKFVVKWNLSELKWHTPGGNAPNGPVYAVLVDYPNIYYGGEFSSAGGVDASGLVRYNMSTHTWSALGTGLSGCLSFLCDGPAVYALALNGAQLYVGGDFANAGGTIVHGLARIDLSSNFWYDVGGGVTCTGVFCTAVVRSLHITGNNLFVGGVFLKAGAVTVNNVAEWNGSSWSTLHDGSSGVTGTNGSVNSIEINTANSNIYVGGTFTSPATNIARWDGLHWYSVGTGTLNGAVNAVHYKGATLYIGGNFTNAGGSGANYLARLSGSSWATVGGSVDAQVLALADNGLDLFVGGDFTTAGVLPVNHIARWNGLNWLALGSGVGGVPGFSRSPTVHAIAVDNLFVYLGGNMHSAGPYLSDNVAIWGGSMLYLPQVTR